MTATRPVDASGAELGRSSRKALLLVLRSVKLLAALVVLILILVLAAFSIIASRALWHLGPIDNHLAAITRLQRAGLDLEVLTVGHLVEDRIPDEDIAKLRRDLAEFIARDGLVVPDSKERLANAQIALSDLGDDPGKRLVVALKQIRITLADETAAHSGQLSRLRDDLFLEFGITGIALIVLSGLGILLVIRLRNRVLNPLDIVEHYLVRLAQRDYSMVPVDGVDPMIQPLTESYNHLVVRLKELEKESARYRNSLEQEVRTATETLLVQNRNLAAAERLATAGEVAARIAHELRNPLAGMQMALSNIRADCQDRTDVVERVDLVIDELRRITGLLNGLLDRSRITPEPVVDTAIGKAIEELLMIVRYQIPKEINLKSNIDAEINCCVPKDSLRQALLNLILNAADAIGPNPGEIIVRAAVRDDMLDLSVSDDGPGFPAELLREGISPFRTGRAGGTGLGLSIVSRLVRNLDGRIELENVEPHGARVRLMLPLRRDNA